MAEFAVIGIVLIAVFGAGIGNEGPRLACIMAVCNITIGTDSDISTVSDQHPGAIRIGPQMDDKGNGP